MHRNNDINQVSMSSIEPAANIAMNVEAEQEERKNQKNNKHMLNINNKSSEKDDSFAEPSSVQDLENVQVTDIPEFTIGPGTMNASVGRGDEGFVE